MNCTICNKPITLTPSASERERKNGGKPSDYTAMFTEHSSCAIKKRNEDTSALMKRITAASKQNRVSYPAMQG